jgi:hypothetical protein
MSGLRLRGMCYGSVIAGIVTAGVALGQTPDMPRESGRRSSREYLEQVRRLTEIAGQKVEADVRDALREAERLMPTDPGRAAEALKNALAQVTDDVALTPERREGLVRQLKSRLRQAEAAAARGLDRTPRPPARNLRGDEDRRADDTETIRRSLETIRRLRLEGKFDDARTRADELARRYPENATVQAALRTTGTSGSVASARSQREEADRRLTGVSQELDRAATTPLGEIEFPRDWRERVKKRSAPSALTDKEKAILQALDSTIQVRFKVERLEDALKYISELIGQPIVVDKAALQEAQVTYDTQTSLETPASGLAARTVLRKLLSEFGLAYIIKDQTIEVTTTVKAQKTMVTRTYVIGDLINSSGGFGGFLGLRIYGPAYTQAQMAQQIKELIETIKTLGDPQSWEGPDGGSVVFHAPTMSLIVRQTAEVHAMLGGGMAR